MNTTKINTNNAISLLDNGFDALYGNKAQIVRKGFLIKVYTDSGVYQYNNLFTAVSKFIAVNGTDYSTSRD